jgi:hypothetical protein
MRVFRKNSPQQFMLMLAIAKEMGFMISADELQQAQAELTDEELEGVVGGAQAGLSLLAIRVRC